MKTILVFGNEDLDIDSGAIKIMDELKKKLPDYIIFPLSRPEQLMDFIGRDFIILDVAKGIKEPCLITDIDNIKYGKKITAHDLDLGAFLKTLKSLGDIERADIVAIPYDKKPDVEKIVLLIKSI
jgi:hypothetical protein